MIIGTYKLISGRRVRLPAAAAQHIGVEGKGDLYELSMTAREIIVAPAGVHIVGAVTLGQRKVYDNAGKLWVAIPIAARSHYGLHAGSSLRLEATTVDGYRVLKYKPEVI